MKCVNPSSSVHIIIYALLPAFFIHSLSFSATSLLPTPSPPHPGAELQRGDPASALPLKMCCYIWLKDIFFTGFLSLFLADEPYKWRASTPISKQPILREAWGQSSDPLQRVPEMYSLLQAFHWLKDHMDHTRWSGEAGEQTPSVLRLSSALCISKAGVNSLTQGGNTTWCRSRRWKTPCVLWLPAPSSVPMMQQTTERVFPLWKNCWIRVYDNMTKLFGS